MHRRSLLGMALGLPATRALAQPASGRPLRILIGLTAGSSIDIKARAIAPLLSARLGQPVIVDNKPGASGIVSVRELMKSAPDGNTVLLGSLSPLAVNMALVKNLPYDPRRDISPISGFFVSNQVLVVRSDLPARSMHEFIALAKQRPGLLSAGYATTLVQAQIAALSRRAGIELLPIPYKGTPPILTELLGGSLDATLLDAGNAMPQVKTGKLHALGVTSLRRNPVNPGWPAIAETLAGFDLPSWTAMVGPPGLPQAAVRRLNAAMNEALNQPSTVENLHESASLPLLMSPEQLKSYIEAEVAKWIGIARDNNIQPA